jgi:hypothetical protein
MGTYTLQSQTNDGRPVYRYGDEYLYYHSATMKWFVGHTVGLTSGLFLKTDPTRVMTPDLVTSGWDVWANSAWIRDSGVKVACAGKLLAV